jgi:predicted Zn-ribbon and HTH transcriptional regulator
MRERDAEAETTRQRIADHLRETADTPSGLAEIFDLTAAAALDHVSHLAQSLAGADEELLVRPPECRDCGFDGFDDLLNRPSRCPECKSESVADPVFTIE